MILQELTATFGCLNNETLRLRPGLNVLQAPNEAGKSTWLAFLRAMLYGLPGRERGPLAEKNRYAPWNGAAMQGRMTVLDGQRTLVLTRDTAPGGAPMGRFSAVYAGTAAAVEGMTGQNAGERLTGVPRSVYERSAMIRQSGLAVDQDAELEKRILALISSGDETLSYSEAEKRLRSALNQRRHNKTGLLPRTEAALEDLREKRGRLRALQDQIQADRTALRETERAMAALSDKLALHRRLDAAEAQGALAAARAELERAEAEAARARRAIGEKHIPPAEQLLRIKFNAANLLTTQVSMNHVQSQAEEAAQQTAQAKAGTEAFPFAPEAPEAAAARVRALTADYDRLMHTAAPGIPLIALLTAAAAAALAGAAYALDLPYALAAAAAVVPAVLTLLRSRSRKRSQARAGALLVPYGVSSPAELEPLLIQYKKAYDRLAAAKANEAQVNASWQNCYQTYKKLSGEILEETSAFCPDVQNVHEIAPLLDAGLRQWKDLQRAEKRAGELRARCAALAEVPGAAAEGPAEAPALRRPAEPPAALEAALAERAEERRELRSRIDRAEGEAAAVGDRLELEAQAEDLERRRALAQEEYDAIALALHELDAANTELQTRFSPALGRRAGELFDALTGGRYHRVLLDEDLNAAAEGDGAAARSAALLSQGAADQLYLALRLALCELVLPADKAAPLVLDDALTSFDDARMAAALELLVQTAQTRQVLLFTCQKRESVYLQNRENVHIIRYESVRR